VARQPFHSDAAPIKSIFNGVVVIAVILWLLNVFGFLHSLTHAHASRG
jgi:hypothetical protein